MDISGPWNIGINLPVWTILVATLIWLAYRYGSNRFGMWEMLGVPGPKPWPYIGTATTMITQGMRVFDQKCVQKYGKIVGLYEGSAPVLLVSDPELLKQVFVKDFTNFMNRTASPLFTDEANYVFRATLTRLRGDHWKHVRSHLTPTFSAAKLKVMLPQMRDCALLLQDNLLKQSKDTDVDIKQFGGAFAMDVIARTAFGLHVDSQNDSSNSFVYHARKVFETKNINFRLISILLFPFLAKIKTCFGQNQFPPDVVEFFSKITSDAMKRRRETKQTRVDFLQLMINSKIPESVDDPDKSGCQDDENDQTADEDNSGHLNGSAQPKNQQKQGLTHEEILAQSLLFFIAGYETTASTITYLAYSLATNPHIQRTLQEELDKTVNSQEITYEMLNEMPYLDMCIRETLRMYPPATRVLRACNQDTLLGDLLVRRGTLIAIPIYTIHHDPDHWPNPDQFIPERFLASEKATRAPCVWLPFGAGPRNCIGMRLAMIELKVAVVTILSHLEFHVTDKTKVPLQFKTNMILTTTEPIRLGIRPRKTL